MRQRLGIAVCLIADPELILDEPMNGLDPAGMLELRGLIRSLVAEGRTVVLSSHLLDEVEKTCDAIAIADRGTVLLQGRIDELTDAAAATLRLECSDPEACGATPALASRH
jgi:ABC-2 type transport system ATP-binding protein